ncbi:MAG TPA: hypothetical protein VEW69_07670, partial [Alphaproteobacteria bacterium]|nr:hypothetical protein [Alphaproteobacteria bacterium]
MKTPSKKSAKDQTDRDGPTAPSLPLILETCALLPQLGGDRAALHKAIAQGAQKILAGELAGVFTRHGDTLLETVVAEGEPGLRSALASHAKAFAAEAMEKNKPLDFKFSYKGGDEAGVYFGLAVPLVTPNLAAALLVLRTTAFSSVESSALGTLGSVAKLVMEKTELAGV